MRLTFIGKRSTTYNGFDPATKQTIRANAGDTLEVSDTKGEKLMADFPGDWVPAGKTKVTEPAVEVKPETPSEPEPEPMPTKRNKMAKPKKVKRK